MNWDPTRSSSGPGYYSCVSKRNRDEDVSKIFDLRDQKILIPGNICKFPTKAYVINLDSRADRWETFQHKNRDLFSNFKVERFSAIEERDRKEAIFNSFLRCMEFGFEDQEAIIIMEDDCYLAPGAIEKIRKAWGDLPEDWDCMIGNHYLVYGIDILTENLAKPRMRASTANFCLMRNTLPKKIQENLHLKVGPNAHIDHFLTSEETPINNFTIWPMISREFLSFSDHKGKVRNMEPYIAEHSYLYQFIDGDTYYPSLESW